LVAGVGFEPTTFRL